MVELTDLESAQKHFAARGDQPWVVQHGFSLMIRRGALAHAVDISWFGPQRVVWVIMGLDATPLPEHRSAMMEAVSKANNSLAVSGFQLRTGLVFRTHVFLDTRQTCPADVLEHAVDLAIATVEAYGPYLHAIAKGEPPPPFPEPK